MAVIIGGTEDSLGKNNRLIGTKVPDLIFGDPFPGNASSEPFLGDGFFGEEIPFGPDLMSGRGGNDRIEGRGGSVNVAPEGEVLLVGDALYGDALVIYSRGIGGNDRLDGGAGPDEVSGDALLMHDARGGNDRLRGGNGDDYLFGDAGGITARYFNHIGDRLLGEMAGNARGGNDRLHGDTGNDQIYGDTELMVHDARGGNDCLRGGRGNDNLFGDASDMYDSSRGGDDSLHGGKGNDQLIGDAYFMYDRAQSGDDELHGGKGNDILVGDGDSLVFNEDGSIGPGSSQGGNDTLCGGEGDDILIGDGSGMFGGADRFVFAPGSDLDTIWYFEQGTDRIDVRAYRITADEFGQYVKGNVVDFDRTRADVNEVSVFSYNSPDQIPVRLVASDFIFAACC